jgi:4-hydroxy-3-polyprenylbenzoate decarboxylase
MVTIANTAKPLPVVLGLTGASGSILGLTLLKELLHLNIPVELVLSEKSLLVMHQETGFQYTQAKPEQRLIALCQFLNIPPEKADFIQLESNKNIGASAASGSHRTAGMVIAPCSMGTMAKIACGISDNLLTRSADVTLKEGRLLILMPRETPLNAIHLENMLKLARLGVKIVPPMLSFYAPQFETVEGQVHYSVGKILDLLGYPHTLYDRWQGLTTPKE